MVMPEEASRVAALKAGKVDFIPEVSLATALGLEGDTDVAVTTSVGTRGRMVEMNVTKPPFDNLSVRQAMNYCVDIQEIIDTLYGEKESFLPGRCSIMKSMSIQSLRPMDTIRIKPSSF